MSYQVLARKWRPKNFRELVGQEHVQRALINALDNNRLHHAFLFTGTRGVGKTTIARILAKSLNCESGVSANPCDNCSACNEINDGRFVDLIEVDAASRTKVEDTRELLENVQYAPTRGRYKVYLIDEVHMLSTHSFNALLKTLEEPPPHVKFLLATTDPQRLPVTILSRCLQFNLKRLPADLITQQLAHILDRESITAQSEALSHIANAADGSMRDALSLLDQAIAFGGGALTTQDVCAMLGTVDQSYVFDLLNLLSAGEAEQLLQRIGQIAEHSPNFSRLLDDMMSLFHRISLAQLAPKALDASDNHYSDTMRLAQAFSKEDVQLYYQIALIGKRDLPLAPHTQSGFEMVMLRMLAFQPAEREPAQTHAHNSLTAKVHTQNTSVKTPARQPDNIATPSTAATQKTTTSQAHRAPAASHEHQSHTPASAPKTAASLSLPQNAEQWEQMILRLPLNGIALQLAKNCCFKHSEGLTIQLSLSPSHQQLLSPARQDSLAQNIGAELGTDIKLKINIEEDVGETPAGMERKRLEARQRSAVDEINNDGVVKHIIDAFDAQLNPASIEPID